MVRRLQSHLLGRVATLAGAITLSALVSLIMLPFTIGVHWRRHRKPAPRTLAEA